LASASARAIQDKQGALDARGVFRDAGQGDAVADDLLVAGISPLEVSMERMAAKVSPGGRGRRR
jgi:hypothetical protein